LCLGDERRMLRFWAGYRHVPRSEPPTHRDLRVCANPSSFPYQCPYCTGLFDDPDARAAHMREQHPDKPVC